MFAGKGIRYAHGRKKRLGTKRNGINFNLSSDLGGTREMMGVLELTAKLLINLFLGLWLILIGGLQRLVTFAIMLIAIQADSVLHLSQGNKAVQLIIVFTPFIYCVAVGAGRRTQK